MNSSQVSDDKARRLFVELAHRLPEPLREVGLSLRERRGVTMTLRQRVAELEAEVQENRQLNRRIAELTDVVTELLIPLAERDDAAAREVIDGYRSRI